MKLVTFGETELLNYIAWNIMQNSGDVSEYAIEVNLN
jgi:hypothetical protein